MILEEFCGFTSRPEVIAYFPLTPNIINLATLGKSNDFRGNLWFYFAPRGYRKTTLMVASSTKKTKSRARCFACATAGSSKASTKLNLQAALAPARRQALQALPPALPLPPLGAGWEREGGVARAVRKAIPPSPPYRHLGQTGGGRAALSAATPPRIKIPNKPRHYIHMQKGQKAFLFPPLVTAHSETCQ